MHINTDHDVCHTVTKCQHVKIPQRVPYPLAAIG